MLGTAERVRAAARPRTSLAQMWQPKGRSMTTVAAWVGLMVVLCLLASASAQAASTFTDWGSNDEGLLGDGISSGPETCGGLACSTVPLAGNELSGVKAISSGGYHSLALLANGTVVAWGENRHGDLGDGNTISSDVPVPVSGLSGVAAVAAGGEATNEFSLALLKNGTVMAWGANIDGALGDGTEVDSDIPVAVTGLTGVTAISAGTDSAMALLKNGTVMAWGENGEGQLGDGTDNGPETCEEATRYCSVTPVAVSGLSDITAISAGYYQNEALTVSGTVMIWGGNEVGDLGVGTSTGPEVCLRRYCSMKPVSVSGLSGVTAIAAGGWHSLALLSDGTVMAWGDNESGELGDGLGGPAGGPEKCESNACSTVPVPVSGLTGVTAIAAGEDNSSLAVLSSGGVSAWGENNYGDLGNGTWGSASYTPVAVSDLSTATAATAGFGFSVAVATEPGPTSLTEAASPITATEEQLNATVNANGESMSECFFEWGTTPSYGKVVPCSALPPSGGTSPVNVDAVLPSLASNATYYARLVASGAGHTYRGGGGTFTTLLSSASGTSSDPSIPATATDGELSASAAGGTGTITVGDYSAAPAGIPPYMSSGAFVDVHITPGSTFTSLEFTDCALNGGSQVSWNNAGVWEPVSSESAAFAGCVTVFVNSGTRPSLAQMTGTVFGGVLPTAALPGVGRCDKLAGERRDKHTIYKGQYTNSSCTTESPTKQGQYEWVQAYAKGAFKGKGGVAKIETVGKVKIACTGDTTAGHYTNEGLVAMVTFSGCVTGTAKCETLGNAEGVIKTARLAGAIGFTSKLKPSVGVALKPASGSEPYFASFECAGTLERLEGTLNAEVGKVDKMASTLTVTLKQSKGKQTVQNLEGQSKTQLSLSTGPIGSPHVEEVGVSDKSTETGEEALEIKAKA
jgi:alpha-tubulin suppressor-like RCC1 family protein